MKTMLTVILTLIFTGISSSQINDVYTKFIAPEYVPQNSDFQIVSLVKKAVPDIDSLELRLNIDSGIKLDSVLLLGDSTLSKLPTKIIPSVDFNKIGYVNYIDFEDSSISSQNFLRVVYYLNSDSKEKIAYRFDYRYKLQTDSTALSSFFFTNNKEEEIKSYKTSDAKGYADLIKEGESLEIFSATEELNNKIFSFWMKLTRAGESEISFYDKASGDSLCSVSIGNDGLLQYCLGEDLTVFDDFAFSPNAWYNVECFFERENESVLLFVNNNLLAEKKLFSSQLPSAPTIKVNAKTSEVMIDDIKVLEYSGSYEQFMNERHELGDLPDSLTVAFAENFDGEIRPSENSKSGIRLDEINVVHSDAPVFLPMPELNLNVYSTYYLLEWKAVENVKPKEFILQKSVDGINYSEVFRQEFSGGEGDKTFSFTDARTFSDDVVYYRVLQINEDGSEVYSNQVKVGQGEIEEFAVEQNYPNPFNPVTNFKVEVFVPGEYRISVFDLVGKHIQTLYKGELSAGVHSFAFDGTELPSGIYFYEIISPHSSKVMKMILAK